MGKSVKFNDSDQGLINKIEEYKKEYNIKYFSETVRKLCAYALEVGKIKH